MSSGERKRKRLNPASVRAGRRCGWGVVGYSRVRAAALAKAWCGVSGRLLGRVAVVGESPVRENITWVVVMIPE